MTGEDLSGKRESGIVLVVSSTLHSQIVTVHVTQIKGLSSNKPASQRI